MNLLDADEIILDTQHGLGDHLILSTLPERFARLGKAVKLSRLTYDTKFAVWPTTALTDIQAAALGNAYRVKGD